MIDLALVRAVPDSFADALVLGDTRPKLDVTRARHQHAAYTAMLDAAGYIVRQVPTDEDHPDCVFIEDTVVIVGDTAVITRSGAPSRRGETRLVCAALPPELVTRSIEPPGTLDGGDVFTIGDRLYVGRSRRTNASGIAQLAAVAAERGLKTVPVAVSDALHLKSAVLPIDTQTVLVTRHAADEGPFGDLQIIYEAETERHDASALPLRNGTILVTAAAPVTASRLSDAGYDVAPIDVSELQAADGGLTCLSVLI